MHQGKILTHQSLDVAHQLGFTVVAVKHRLLKPGRLATRNATQLSISIQLTEIRWDRSLHRLRQNRDETLDLVRIREFIQADSKSLSRLD